MNFKNIELSFQSVLDYYINQQQISCRIIKNESAWDREKQDILERANWLSDKIIVEPEILLKNYGSRSKKGEFQRFELSHNALNRKPRK